MLPLSFILFRLVLVGGELLDDRGHLLVRVYSEPLFFRHARQLHILGVELLLHDLLQRLEHQRLGVGDGEGLEGKGEKPLRPRRQLASRTHACPRSVGQAI